MSIRTLGFRVEDIELIVNSHAHFDHAGGIAELQRVSGATTAAARPATVALRWPPHHSFLARGQS